MWLTLTMLPCRETSWHGRLLPTAKYWTKKSGGQAKPADEIDTLWLVL
jgi:hypothetical protein